MVHEFLQNVCLLTLHFLIDSMDNCMQLLQDLAVIPTRTTRPYPMHHNMEMVPMSDLQYKLGWRLRCAARSRNCHHKVNPSDNTVISNTKLDVRVFVALAVMNVCRVRMSDMIENLNCWRRRCFPLIGDTSPNTVVNWNSMIREVGQVIISHRNEVIGTPGCTIECDETFLKRQKYSRGTRIWTTTVCVFGILCRETKQIRYFRVPDKSRRSLFPILKKYVHPEVAVICTDGAATYAKVDELFPGAEHKVVNHRHVFVDPDDNSNHINSIEGENSHLKKSIRSRRTEELVDQYIGWHCYFREFLRPLASNGERVQLFLSHVKEVYPGYMGIGTKGVCDQLPTPEETGIANLPCMQIRELAPPVPVEEPITDDDAAGDDDDPDYEEEWSHESDSGSSSSSSTQTD